jgi:phosphoglycolate phosphatase-like HAD superfamily hydrolase
MNVVFQEMWGIEDGFGKIEFSGRTDRFILHGALEAHGIDGDFESHLSAITARYSELLPSTLEQMDGKLMPGFPEMLEALTSTPGVQLGLATGNLTAGARHKLRYYGIERFFAAEDGGLLGGFGEESLDRSDVVSAAIQRLAPGTAPEDVLVIGDTPKDIAAALDNGVTAVGVATGNYSNAELHGSGAHLVFEDFSDWQAAAGVLAGSATA